MARVLLGGPASGAVALRSKRAKRQQLKHVQCSRARRNYCAPPMRFRPAPPARVDSKNTCVRRFDVWPLDQRPLQLHRRTLGQMRSTGDRRRYQGHNEDGEVTFMSLSCLLNVSTCCCRS